MANPALETPRGACQIFRNRCATGNIKHRLQTKTSATDKTKNLRTSDGKRLEIDAVSQNRLNTIKNHEF